MLPNFGGSSLFMPAPFNAERAGSVKVTRRGEECFLGSATPWSPAMPNFGVPSIYVYILRRRTTELGVVTHVEDLFLGQPRLLSQRGLTSCKKVKCCNEYSRQ